MARHRHAVNVRADGLTAVLGPLADDPAVVVALLVDIDSGMVLGATGPLSGPDREEVGAVHGELMRLGCGPATEIGGDPPGHDGGLDTEVAVRRGPRRHLVMRRVADPHGDRLALSVLVDGSPRVLRRVRRRLDAVSTAALTAGPTVSLRPRDGTWVPGAVESRAAPRVLSRAPGRAVPVRPPEPMAGGRPALAALDESLLLPSPGPRGDALAALPPPLRPVPPPQRGPQPAERGPAPPSALPPSGPAAS